MLTSYLWNNCHSLHHHLDHPSPVSTLHINNVDGIDAFLESAFPILVSSIVARPHLVPDYEYMVLRVSENAIKHSGLNT